MHGARRADEELGLQSSQRQHYHGTQVQERYRHWQGRSSEDEAEKRAVPTSAAVCAADTVSKCSNFAICHHIALKIISQRLALVASLGMP